MTRKRFIFGLSKIFRPKPKISNFFVRTRRPNETGDLNASMKNQISVERIGRFKSSTKIFRQIQNELA